MIMSRDFPFYTTAEAAEVIGITQGRLCQLLRAGILKGRKAGQQTWLIPKREVERFQSTPQKTGRPRVGR